MAFVGPDGAGKSTVTREVTARLGESARRIYMGVNLEEATISLPTTRLLLIAKRMRGRRPDMAAWHSEDPQHQARPSARDVIRIFNLIAEECFRALIVAYHIRRGRTVVMDRHFVADYWKHDVSPDDPARRSWLSRLHGRLLLRYPVPDHVVLLDAELEMLLERKSEASAEFLSGRRSEYLELGQIFGGFTTISTEQPLELVVDQCLAVIESARDARS